MGNSHIKKTINTYNKIVKEYVKNTRDTQPVPELMTFISFLPKKARILDAGCGWGRDSKTLTDYGFDIIGVDLSEGLLKEAKKYSPFTKFLLMDIRDLKFPDNYFEGIWCNSVIFHLKKKEILLTLQEFYRVLKSDGICFVSVKGGKGEGFVADDFSAGLKRFYTLFSLNEIKALVKKAKFKILKVMIYDERVRFGREKHREVFNLFCQK